LQTFNLQSARYRRADRCLHDGICRDPVSTSASECLRTPLVAKREFQSGHGIYATYLYTQIRGSAKWSPI
jgi:hypothetical protein